MIELYTNNLLKFDFCDNKILGCWEIVKIGVVSCDLLPVYLDSEIQTQIGLGFMGSFIVKTSKHRGVKHGPNLTC